MKHVMHRLPARLRAAEPYLITVVRVLIGVFFCISGGTKLFVPSQFSLMRQTMIQSHIPFPDASALFVSSVEFGCGGALALGLLTPLCALLLAGDMTVAIFTNRIGSIHTSGLAWLDDFLYLPEVLYVLILLWLLFSGPGRYSIDAWIERRTPPSTSAGSTL